MIRVTVWNENVHDQEAAIRAIYPSGLHGAIADALREDAEKRFSVRTATLDQPAQGLPDEILNDTDVLFWWGHVRHNDVSDALIERIARRVRDGMGLIVLHSGHYSKLFRRLMGTECRSKWWENGDHERIFTVMPGHPIAMGLPEFFELPIEETYGEHFDIPKPDDLIFVSWIPGGEVFRSGCTWHRGLGRIFYFQPGHESCPSYHDKNVQLVITNAVRWAYRPQPVYQYVTGHTTALRDISLGKQD